MRKYTFLLLGAVFTLALFTGICTATQAKAPNSTSTANVIFGSGIGCTGKGICNVSSTPSGTTVPVTFQLMGSDPGIVQLSLSLSILHQNQPGQDPYLQNPDIKTYQFDAVYAFSEKMITALGLQAGAMVQPTDRVTLQRNGDMLFILIAYSHK